MPPSSPPSVPAILAKSASPPVITPKAFSSQLHHKNAKPKRPPLTHFLCIPLVNQSSSSQLQTSLQKFKEDLAAWKGPLTKAAREHSPCEQEEGPSEAAANPKEEVAQCIDKGTSMNTSTQTASVGQILLPAVRPLGTLHLTLGVMSLTTPDRLQEAVSYLQTKVDVHSHLRRALNVPETPPSTEACTHAQEKPCLKISLRGLKTMASPRKTSVLYAEPHFHSQSPSHSTTTSQENSLGIASNPNPPSPLLTFCKSIRHEMLQAGFLLPDTTRNNPPASSDAHSRIEEPPLLLHMTILNTIYIRKRDRKGDQKWDRKGKGNSSGPGGSGVRWFDARELVERGKEWVWAEGVQVGRVAVCEMGAREGVGAWGEDGRGVGYRDVGGVDL